ncbi:MAG: hypothetical protein ACREAB_07215 [Blastocatellia bacterium]
MDNTQLPKFKEWCIVELLGHVRIAGLVTEVELFGSKQGRIDIPNGDTFVTQYFNGSSLYRLTPTTEEIARAVAASNQPEPVHRWELPKQKQITAGEAGAIDADDDDGVGATGHEFPEKYGEDDPYDKRYGTEEDI